MQAANLSLPSDQAATQSCDAVMLLHGMLDSVSSAAQRNTSTRAPRRADVLFAADVHKQQRPQTSANRNALLGQQWPTGRYMYNQLSLLTPSSQKVQFATCRFTIVAWVRTPCHKPFTDSWTKSVPLEFKHSEAEQMQEMIHNDMYHSLCIHI